MRGAAPADTALTTYADLVWPAASGSGWRAGIARALVLALLGACLLTVSAKVQVPGPVPMTLQTLAVLALGAMLGLRLAVASVLLYCLQGALGLPVFANTPPLAPGLAYLAGPTGGFLLGFVLAAAIVGGAADRGLARRPLAFALALAAGSLVLLLSGWAWLSFGLTVSGRSGLGPWRAFEMGVRPFLLGEGIKLALAAIGLPLVLKSLGRIVAR